MAKKRKALLSCPACGNKLVRGKGTHTQNATDVERLSVAYLSCPECGIAGKATIHIIMQAPVQNMSMSSMH